MKLKRLIPLLGLSALALGVTGCVWLRLLDFKNQLGDLDRYADVGTTNGLTIHFRKPVLYADDLHVFASEEPLKATNGSRVVWSWVFEKQRIETNSEIGDFDLVFTSAFEHGKFSEMGFPDRFLTMLPQALTLGLLRSVGHAEINLKTRSATLRWDGGTEKENVELPTKAQVAASLGIPFVATEAEHSYTWVYKYKQKSPSKEPDEQKLVWASLTFDRGSDRVVKCRGGLGNVGWWVKTQTNKLGADVHLSFVNPSLEPVALPLDSKRAEAYVGKYQGAAGDFITIGREDNLLTASGTNGTGVKWCVILPETRTVFFSPPGSRTRWIFKDQTEQVTNLVLFSNGSSKSYNKIPSEALPEPSVVKLDPKIAKDYVGWYAGPWGSVFIRLEGEQLYWRDFKNECRLKIYPASTTDFFFKAVDCPFKFVRDDSGDVKKMILHYNGRDLEARKLF